MYENSSLNPIKYILIVGLLIFVLAGLFLLPLIITKAQTSTTETPTQNPSATPTPKGNLGQPTVPNVMPFNFSGLFGGSGNASLAGEPVITVVNVEGSTQVYRIINGLKHAIPTTQIFYSYGFSLGTVQKITAKELNQYPTARLFKVDLGKDADEKDVEKTYYLNESGMLREIISDDVFYSYGNRKENIITINQKEFNYYPRTQYIYIERPQIDRNIYQITGGIKRYLTPVAVKRLDLKESEIAPVNQFEFDAYPEGEPVIF